MAQTRFGRTSTTLYQRRRRTRALLLLGASAVVLAMVLPARAQADTIAYGDGDAIRANLSIQF
jgi:hypothetical protein